MGNWQLDFVSSIDENASDVYAVALPPVDIDYTGEPSRLRQDLVGTAFQIGPEGHFLTAHHILEKKMGEIESGAREVALKGTGPASCSAFRVNIKKGWAKHDLVLLEAEEMAPRNSYISLASHAGKRGTWIWTAGYIKPTLDPAIDQVKLEQRVGSAMISNTYHDEERDTRTLEIDRSLFWRNSGGPIVTMGGYAIAVATQRLHDWSRLKMSFSPQQVKKILERAFIDNPDWDPSELEDIEVSPRVYIETDFTHCSSILNISEELSDYDIDVEDPGE